ncbi:hypothetical protein MUCCIDRAFT_116091 [Mucor lusitanicus CBS 277.49]|uniref:ER transporter 6TM N-terminal domain-containing protein n=1 Tax=Mucor lusitanicus CBS 277.49 TaxID=747725 RepID=A0A162YAU7_MUCCL|nr:hypothetical protein MUCCIDRAFT_116091 [Mucor lusitanicus CBS 277.49]
MENIELSQQTSRKSYATTVQSDQVSFSNTADHLSARNVYKHDEDDMMTANHPPPRLSGESNSSIHMPPDPHGVEHKKTFSQRIKAKIPPLPLIRAIVKASFAVLIALIIAFVDTTRNAIGQGIILVPIGTILHFPIRPLGVQLEATIQGLFGALVGSAWCMLGMYLGNLARDPAIPTPVQPNSSAVLAVFMFIGVFGLTYVRNKFAQANFACIFASMIAAFALTQAAVTPGFQPTIVYTFLIPIALSAGIALAVDVLIWPDDSITKYMSILNVSLKEYNSFFQEHSNAFLSTTTSPEAMTLPSLHARLQNSILKLIDCKREIQREVLFNRLAHDDINSITRLVKTMRMPLHGIGLSLITKAERLDQVKQPYFAAAVADDQSEHKRQFLLGLEELRKVSQELTDTCVMTLGECNERLMKFSGKPRSMMSTILWPFPRIFIRDYYKSNKQQQEQQHTRIQSLSERLDQVIYKYEMESKKTSHIFIEPGADKFEARFNGLLQIIYLFQYNLMEHALQLRSLVACVESIEATRTRRRLWLPHLKLRKWFRSLSVSANFGGPVGTTTSSPETGGTGGGGGGGNDLTLSQTMTRPDNLERDDDMELVCRRNRQGKAYPRDPDVNPPETAFENFFYQVHHIVNWAKSVDAVFAFKTSAGFTLLSLPAFLASSATWFFAWRGQWATITLMLWMFPMAGIVILRVLGTVLGGVAGIVVWEITRGNPYGLSVLMFFVMMPLYYVFFTSQIMNIVAIMTQITLILVVIMEYTYVVSGAPTFDSVEIVAGKRMLLVIIGVAAAAILAVFPKAVTGRVELRKRISRTIHDLSKLYGILVGDILATKGTDAEPTPGQRKAFRKLALGIRRQIADEQTYLKITKLEPPLRGKFPVEEYTKLVEKVDNMADLLQGMAFASRSIDKAWKRKLVRLASILSIMKLLSATLASKMALPPFMLSPTELRLRLARKMSQAITRYPENLDNDTFPSYCAFAVNSFKFSGELAEVMECIEKLVGVEDPQQWLLLNA